MKNILLLFISLFLFSGTAHAVETKDLWKCDVEHVLLVDVEEAAWLGKEIGTSYQCLSFTVKGYLFFDPGKEDLAVLIDPRDPRYRWYEEK